MGSASYGQRLLDWTLHSSADFQLQHALSIVASSKTGNNCEASVEMLDYTHQFHLVRISILARDPAHISNE